MKLVLRKWKMSDVLDLALYTPTEILRKIEKSISVKCIAISVYTKGCIGVYFGIPEKRYFPKSTVCHRSKWKSSRKNWRICLK